MRVFRGGVDGVAASAAAVIELRMRERRCIFVGLFVCDYLMEWEEEVRDVLEGIKVY